MADINSTQEEQEQSKSTVKEKKYRYGYFGLYFIFYTTINRF